MTELYGLTSPLGAATPTMELTKLTWGCNLYNFTIWRKQWSSLDHKWLTSTIL